MDKFILVKVIDADKTTGRYGSNLGKMMQVVRKGAAAKEIRTGAINSDWLSEEDNKMLADIFKNRMEELRAISDKRNRANPLVIR